MGGPEVSDNVLYVAPASAEWKGCRGPLWAQADELRDLATEFGATFVVVDSAVPACGAVDPLKSEAAGQYAMGLERIGRPSLTLAHVTKANDGRMPFGSGFWHHLSRITWHLGRDGETLIATNRKANNYEHLGRYVVTFAFMDGLLGEVSEKSYAVALSDLIDEALTDGPRSLSDVFAMVCEELPETKRETVQRTLTRHCPARYRKDGELWRRS